MVRVGLARKKTGQVTDQPVFASGQKYQVRVGNFLDRARKFWPILLCLGTDGETRDRSTGSVIVAYLESECAECAPSGWVSAETVVGSWAGRYYWWENHHILRFLNLSLKAWSWCVRWPWWLTQIINTDSGLGLPKYGLWRGLQIDLGLAVLSGLQVITLWTVGLRGCITFGPTSLTSDPTIAHLPSFPRTIRIKRSKVNSDFVLLLSIPFIVDKIFVPSCSLCLWILSLLTAEISRVWILNKCSFILSFISSVTIVFPVPRH